MDFGHTEPDLNALDDLVQNNTIDRLRRKLNKNKKKKEVSPYNNNFDDYTEIEVKALRIAKQDPIDNESFYNEEYKAFVFRQMWDPYTGERLGNDPVGPLYFNPINLIYHWYRHRLDNIWINSSDEQSGFWSGVPGELFGSGNDCYIPGRGFMKDKYLFRIPLSLCYISKDIGYTQAVTMGPVLTDNEIKDIYVKAKTFWEKEYKKRFRRKLPNLIEMKKNYDIAIKKNPLGPEVSDEENHSENKKGVDYLINLC